MTHLTIVWGWMITIFVGMLGLLFLWFIITGRIDLTYVLSERDGMASLARLQFLVVVLTIAGGFLFVVIRSPEPALPNIPGAVLILLGISGGTYLLSKGIEAWRGVREGIQPPMSEDLTASLRPSGSVRS